MAGSRPVTPASPKILRPRTQEPGVPMFGCEHIQILLTRSPEVTTNTIAHYKMLLRVIFDKTAIISQTSATSEGRSRTSLVPNYLCLQCPSTMTEKGRKAHGLDKSHQFYVDSRSGGLFCDVCEDFVWDPTLEELRVRKIGTGSFSYRKRKHDELFTDSIKEDPKYISSNTTAAPCRANGLRGIYNMGATCFMSVILQSFVHNPLLRNYFLSDGHQTSGCEQDHCLNCCMDDLFQSFYAEDVTAGYSAADILATSWQAQEAAFAGLVGNEEQDAHEYFQFLVEALHKTAKVSRPFSLDVDSTRPSPKAGINCDCIVHQTFYGKSQSTLTCQNCNNVTTSVEPFLDLSLGLDAIVKKRGASGGRGGKGGKGASRPSTLTLERCLDDEYKRPEKCEYTCHNCDSPQDARKQLSIKRLPNVLCIQFKRFEHDKLVGATSKIDVKVQFPLKINMLPYTSRARSQDVQDNLELARSCTYDLLTVVVHTGSKMNTGHYISYSRVGNQWFLFDDHKVTLATESQVLGAEAFILFYIIRSLA